MFNETVKNIENWGELRGLESTKDDVQMKTQRFLQEAIEVHEAVTLDDIDKLKDAIGDTIVTLIMLGKAYGVNIMECTDEVFNVIKLRKGLTSNGQFIRYGKLSNEDKVLCDSKQGNVGSEYFKECDLSVMNSSNFNRETIKPLRVAE